MSRARTVKTIVAALWILGLGGCATAEKWSASGGNRDQGLVRVSYEYAEFRQPEMDDADAEALALNRCNAWGYTQAEPIPGQLRQCANMDGSNCNLWTVTREYQCSGAESTFASRLSR